MRSSPLGPCGERDPAGWLGAGPSPTVRSAATSEPRATSQPRSRSTCSSWIGPPASPAKATSPLEPVAAKYGSAAAPPASRRLPAEMAVASARSSRPPPSPPEPIMRACTSTLGVFHTKRPGWHQTACPASSCTTRSCPELTSLCAIMAPSRPGPAGTARSSLPSRAWPRFDATAAAGLRQRCRAVATLSREFMHAPNEDFPNASSGSAIPLPVHGPESRTAGGRLASWVFDLPVVELRAGYRAAVYFDRARRILSAERDDTEVTIQVFQRNDGVVACGIDEALAVLALGAGESVDQGAADRAFADYLNARNQARRSRQAGGPDYLKAVRAQVEAEVAFDRLWRPASGEVRVRALRDGERTQAWDPVVEITAPYRLIAHLESVYLGVLARRSLVADNVRQVVAAAGGKPVLFFADRFDHWATQGGDGYAAFVGGAQGVATDAQAAWWGERGLGTTPHALIATFDGDTVAAMRAFARHIPDVPLVALVDFDNDCVGTSLACARAFGERLWGVRLDTASTLVDRSLWDQLGDFDPTGVNPQLVRNVRGALDAEGFGHVRVICSGGFTAARITAFERAGVPVDSYAVGSALLKGASDYTADVVLREGRPCAKVGRHHRPSERLQPVDLGADGA